MPGALDLDPLQREARPRPTALAERSADHLRHSQHPEQAPTRRGETAGKTQPLTAPHRLGQSRAAARRRAACLLRLAAGLRLRGAAEPRATPCAHNASSTIRWTSSA